MLLESKAATFQTLKLTESLILNDPTTRAVAEAIVQLNATAIDVRSGRYSRLGVDSSKPIVGAVVTFGDVPFVNSEWYFDQFINPKVAERAGQSPSASSLLANRPAVLSIEAFEWFVVNMISVNSSPIALFEERARNSNIAMGDWAPFLKQRLMIEQPPLLPFVQEAVSEFVKSLAVLFPEIDSGSSLKPE